MGVININLYNSHGIYGIRNKINGKIYIGKTDVSFGDRRDCHFASLRRGYGVNTHLLRSWEKYGEDNFEFIVIHECNSGETHDLICDLEVKYIKEYRLSTGCYNISSGGDGGLVGRKLSDETKRKIGEKNRLNMLGRKASDETRAKMSASQRKRYENLTEHERIEYGKKIAACASGYCWTDELKKNFSERQKIYPNGAKYTVDTVREIRRLYDVCGMTITQISLHLGIARGTVYNIATRRRWKYVD